MNNFTRNTITAALAGIALITGVNSVQAYPSSEGIDIVGRMHYYVAGSETMSTDVIFETNNDVELFMSTREYYEMMEFITEGENSTNVQSSTGGAGGAGKVKYEKLSIKKIGF